MTTIRSALFALALLACASAPLTRAPLPRIEAIHARDLIASASVVSRSSLMESRPAPHFTYDATCIAPDGQVRWHEVAHNTVLTGGKNDLLDKYFKGSGYTAAWYMALKHTGTIAAADVWTSHAGWTEATPYAGNRPAISYGTTSAGSNTATAVSYSINGTDADVSSRRRCTQRSPR